MSRLARASIAIFSLAVLAEVVGVFFIARAYNSMGGETDIAELASIIAPALFVKLVGWIFFISGIITAIVTATRNRPVPGAFTVVAIVLAAVFLLMQVLGGIFGAFLGAFIEYFNASSFFSH